MIDQVTVIIRSVGERTEPICRKLLEEVFLSKNIHTINTRPFSEAIRKAFQLGVTHHLPWTLCIDADVLVTREGIAQLIERSHQLEKNIFEIQGLVLDKFFGVKRPAGNHLYRTDLIPKALELIPEEGKSLRPESDMLNAMSALGYPWAQQEVLVGLHDFEQFYSDIYRKCFLQAHKHQWILPEIEAFWQSMRTEDKDYEVALWGLQSGKVYQGTIRVDKNFLQEEANNVLSLKGIPEKSTFDVLAPDILRKTTFHAANSNYSGLQHRIFPSSLWNRVIALQNHKPASSPAWHQKFLYRMGNKMEHIGKKMKSLSRLKE